MKLEWDLSHLYDIEEKWNEDYDTLKLNVKDLTKKIEDYQYSDKTFNSLLDELFELFALVEKLYCFPARKVDLDYTDEENKNNKNEILKINADVEKLETKIKSIVLENDIDINNYPKYKRYLNIILKQKNHLLSDIEAIKYNQLNKEIETIKSDYHKMINSEIKYYKILNENGKEVLVNNKSYIELLRSNDVRVRKDAYYQMNKSYQDINEKGFNLLNNCYDNLIEMSKLKKYNSVLEMQIEEDELSFDVYKNLINTISNNLEPIDNYNKLRKKILNLEDLHLYDSNLKLTENSKNKYSFVEGIDIVKKSVSCLGDEYVKNVDKALNEGWIDVYENDFKRKDSFSTISYSGVPYTSINYNDNFSSVKILIHELGHAINTDYAKKNNSFVNFEYSILSAEIASKVNEFLLYDYLLKNTDKLEKIEILNSIIGASISSLYFQINLSEFEKTIITKKENNEKITSNFVNDLYYDLIKKYNGNDLIYDEICKYSWVRIPHFIIYRPYYVYKYSLSFCLALKISKDIINNKNDMKNKYLEFLKVGNSINTIDALNILEIDLYNSSYIEEAISYFNNLVKELDEMTN